MACDRGRFEGHAHIESEADLLAFEGYTEISGMLEIMNSEDLVCLDKLACLEVVGRDVRVQNNAALQSTEGLETLRVVGAAYEEASTVVATVFVSENARLETLAGFGLEALRGNLVLWRNPALREVTGFVGLSGSTQLVVLENPVLEALPSLHGVEWLLCSINHNPRLCSAELDAICTPNLESYNGEECPEGPAPRAEYEPGASIQCSVATEDCAEGEKCMPVIEQFDQLACRPVDAQPRAVGASCSFGQSPSDGFDDCERHALCRGFPEARCVSMAFGQGFGFSCPSPDERVWVDASGMWILCLPVCNPLNDECPEGLGCFSDNEAFDCAPLGEPVGAKFETCDSPTACAPGLACVSPGKSSACAQDQPGCCLPFCDVAAPRCPDRLECIPWWSPSRVDTLPIIEHVGVCVEP